MNDPTPPFKSRRKRLLIAIGMLVVLAGIGWWSGLLAAWPRREAVEALRANNLDEAEAYIRRAIRLDGASAESYLLLARIQRKQGEMKGFARSLKKALSHGLDRRQAVNERLLAQAQSGDVASIQSQLDDMLMKGDTDGREILEAYVNGCLAAARLTQAEALIDGWKNAYPDEAQPHYYAGRLLLHYGRNEAAERHFRDALERQPKHHAAAYLLGQILMQQNRPKQALERFRECESMKYNAAPRIAEAKAQRSLGEVDEARRILEGVVKVPREEVKRSFQRVGDRFEGAPAELELGSLESASGRYKQALPWLDAAVRANPRDLSARHAWGIALRGVGRNEEAAAELAAVREARIALREVDRLADLVHKNPDLVDERVRIGELYLKYESDLTGEFWLKTALARDPDNKRAHELLAELYESRTAVDPAYRPLAEHHRQMAAESPERAETDEDGPTAETNEATGGAKE